MRNSIPTAFAAGSRSSTSVARADSRSIRISSSSSRMGCGRTRFGCRAATHRPTHSAFREPSGFMSTNTWAMAGALLSLGALHGLNPGMGWLFAVALGVQQGSRRAVWRALGPLALGHAVAIAAAVAIALGLGVVLPSAGVRWGAAALLVVLGVM